MDRDNGLVTAEFEVDLLLCGPLAVPVRSSWRYGPLDPHAVHLHLALPTGGIRHWAFARALLAEGLDLPAGEGDVLFEPVAGHHHVLLLLRGGPDEPLMLRVDSDPLSHFLNRTRRRVPPGAEHCGRELDNWLHRILDQRPA